MILVVQAHRDNNSRCVCMYGGFLQYFYEMIECCPWVTVYLDVGVIEWWDPVEV